MQITTKTEYAVKALTEIALSENQAPKSIRKICDSQALPIKYTEQLFQKLKKHNLVKSIHGVKGGYVLTRPASEISFLEIMIAVEENYSNLNCDKKEIKNTQYCSGDNCKFKFFFKKVQADLNKYFNNITLEKISNDIKSVIDSEIGENHE